MIHVNFYVHTTLSHSSAFIIVDMRSQGGLLLEDLMKIEWSSFELSWSHYHWNKAYIDEGKEIWWYPWWSRLEHVLSM